MTFYSLDGTRPTLPDNEDYWVAPDANVIGDVIIGKQVSIWFGSTLRGDNEPIIIENGSNIQEYCVLHTDMGFPLNVAADCTIGHRVTLHGCQIERGCLIGMGTTILNGVVIGKYSVVGAGSLLTEGKKFPAKSLILGSPGKWVRQLTDAEIAEFGQAAAHYKSNIIRYRRGLSTITVPR